MVANTAIIDSGAIIGKNVSIGHFCVIGGNVRIGDNCVIQNNVTIVGHTTIGDRNKVYTGAAVGVPPQDLKYDNEPVELIIGDDNIIREFTTLNPGTNGGHKKTIIGNGNLFMAYSHVAHDCVVGNHCILANVATLGGHVELGDYVNLGGLSAVHQFVKVGDGCMLAGGSILVQDAPPYSILEGNRATIRGLNKHRMRKLFSHEEIDLISSLYKELFSRNEPMRDIVVRELERANGNKHIESICNFILNATRGIPFKKKESK